MDQIRRGPARRFRAIANSHGVTPLHDRGGSLNMSITTQEGIERRTLLRRLVSMAMVAVPLAASARTALANTPTNACAASSTSPISTLFREAPMSQSVNPPAPSIVLVHGAFADSSSWNAIIPSLFGQGYPVIAAAIPMRGLQSDADFVASL